MPKTGTRSKANDACSDGCLSSSVAKQSRLGREFAHINFVGQELEELLAFTVDTFELITRHPRFVWDSLYSNDMLMSDIIIARRLHSPSSIFPGSWPSFQATYPIKSVSGSTLRRCDPE